MGGAFSVHGWRRHPWTATLLVDQASDEMYGVIYESSFHPWISLPSMDGAILSMDGGIHQWHATHAEVGMSHAASASIYEEGSMMADPLSLPTSTSSLLLPLASQNPSRTLSSLKHSTLSTSNRLNSIVQDSDFVKNVASSNGLPLVANERCGSWYITPEEKARSAYFKSTDGHWGQWGFSTRRLNLHLLEIIGRCGGWVKT